MIEMKTNLKMQELVLKITAWTYTKMKKVETEMIVFSECFAFSRKIDICSFSLSLTSHC